MEFFISFAHFIFLGLSLAAPIGPMNIEVMKRGLTQGFLASWCVGLGGLTGDVLLLLGIYFGLGEIMQVNWIQIIMYIVGIILLIYLGFQSIGSALTFSLKLTTENDMNRRSAYLTGLMIALANPISLIFWFGVFGTSLNILTSSHSVVFSLACSIAIILGLFLWNLNLVFTVHFSKRLMSPSVMRSSMFLAGFCLLGFACHFTVQLYKLIISLV
ncbi:LysE family translocator [Fictibacillus sp. FJAT-27399]|uniref:LysE family translocator n=1 Tax=Fictibacillus sp. FJAT-27399 TaxID=1729689 RepID=UPI000784E70A|nr:LysE family transporter [Fictibacillus sp. FJAT-27399]